MVGGADAAEPARPTDDAGSPGGASRADAPTEPVPGDPDTGAPEPGDGDATASVSDDRDATAPVSGDHDANRSAVGDSDANRPVPGDRDAGAAVPGDRDADVPMAGDPSPALQEAAEAGDPAAMTALGRRLERAGALPEAWEWWRRAGFAGDEAAMRQLARSLRPDDPAEAQAWHWHAVLVGKQRASGAPPAAVVEAAAGLGALRLTFGHGDGSPGEAQAGCGLLVSLALAAAGFVAALSGGWPAVGIACLALAALVAVVVAVRWMRERGRRHVGFWEYERGLVHRDQAGRVHAIAWADPLVVATPDGHHLAHATGDLTIAAEDLPTGEALVLARIVAHHVSGA